MGAQGGRKMLGGDGWGTFVVSLIKTEPLANFATICEAILIVIY